MGRILEGRPSGFPAYFSKRQQRVVTGDVWAFLRHLVTRELEGNRKREALAFLEQASEFFDAAGNPRMGSKPLLYYYSFLNLVKMALLLRGVPLPPVSRHGIGDPRANIRTRLRFEGQTVRIEPLKTDHTAIFPQFVKILGGDASVERVLRVVDLMEQIPSIHRTFIRVTNRAASFLPMKEIRLFREGSDIWVRVEFDRNDKDVKDTLPLMVRRRAFQRVFRQVNSPEDLKDRICFGTNSIRSVQKRLGPAIGSLAEAVRGVGIWTILTADGYRCYFWNGEPRKALPPLAAVYAVIFYLGSITRYKPYDFDRILAGGHALLVGEILASQPVQFVYGLASVLTGVDVVKPYATLA